MGGSLEHGWAFLSAGNAAGAMRAAKQALNDDPNDVEALDLLQQAHITSRDYRSADEVIKQWLRLSPDDSDAHAANIFLLIALGFQDEATVAIKSFGEAFPHDGHRLSYLEALWDASFGRPDRAASRLQDLYGTFGGDPSILLMLGRALFDARNPLAAEEPIETVLSQDANNVDALHILAFTRYRAFRFGEARALAKQVRERGGTESSIKFLPFLTWVSLFPPFLMGHGLAWMMGQLAKQFGGVAGHVFAGGLGVTIAGIIYWATQVAAVQAPPSKTVAWNIVIALIAAGWALFVHYASHTLSDGSEDRRSARITGGF